MKHQTSRIKQPKSVRGFTLIEVLIATILVGFSIAALMAANGTLSMANGAGTDQSTAEFLAEQIRELTAMLAVVDPQTGTTTPLGPEEASVVSYDDVDDFHGFSSSSLGGPISAMRTVLTEFSAFSQQVTVQNVSLANLDQVVDTPPHSSPLVRVTVRVLKNGRLICTTSWIRAMY